MTKSEIFNMRGGFHAEERRTQREIISQISRMLTEVSICVNLRNL
jgi:hypothetical protein